MAIKNTSKHIRMEDIEAGEMLRAISKHDRRSEGNVVALLVRERYAELFSQPSDALVSQAIDAGGSVPVAG